MKRIVICNVVALLMTSAALRAQTPVATVCDNGTLNGSYGVVTSGTRPAPSVLPNLLFLPGSVEQMVGVAVQMFNGQGTFTVTDNLKGSSSGIIADRPGTGIYSVKANCTGTFTLNTKGLLDPIVTQIVIVDGGAEFRGVVVSPQTVMVTANGRKMN